MYLEEIELCAQNVVNQSKLSRQHNWEGLCNPLVLIFSYIDNELDIHVSSKNYDEYGHGHDWIC